MGDRWPRSPINSTTSSLAPFFECLIYGRDDSDLQLAVQNIKRSTEGTTNVLAVVALSLYFLAQVLQSIWSLSFILGILVSGR